MIRSLNLHRPSAVDLPRLAAPADPSRAAGSGLRAAAAVLAGLPAETVAGIARRAAREALMPPLAPYPAEKK